MVPFADQKVGSISYHEARNMSMNIPARASLDLRLTVFLESRVAKGFCYLMVIMDWASRRVLSWRLSNTMDVSFCLEALEEAMAIYGVPEIFNTDQGSQFTSGEFIGALMSRGIRISMDGKGRGRENIFVERLWRSVKYEEVYLRAYNSLREARENLDVYFTYYNHRRRRQGLDGRTPDEVYFGTLSQTPAAA